MSSRPSTWNVPASKVAKRAHNPIRQIVDKLKIDPKAEKALISLALGTFRIVPVSISDTLLKPPSLTSPTNY
jgi:tyrosine aminotransferase